MNWEVYGATGTGVVRVAWVGGRTAVAGALQVGAGVEGWVQAARSKRSRAMRRGRLAIGG
jgi:hypothetical protein